MGYQQRISSYKNVEFETANPGKLIVMLFTRLEHELIKACKAIEAMNYESKGQSIVHSQEILLELNNSLNMEAGLVAENLRSIYLFLYQELNRINLSNDPTGLAKVKEIVSNISSSWREIVSKTPGGQETKSEKMSVVG